MGPFISLLSETYGLHEPTVAAVARVMREAGWLTTGARGVYAPEMTHVDAARLTLALLSGEPPGKVVEEFEFLRGLEPKTPPPATGFTAGSGLDQAHCLEDGLIWLFGLTSNASLFQENSDSVLGIWYWPSVTVSVDASARAAQIRYSPHICTYEDLARERELDEIEKQPFNLEDMVRGFAIESRSAGWDSTRVALERRMRVVRTITDSEISTIVDDIAASAPFKAGQD
jgi:hypothetical protein